MLLFAAMRLKGKKALITGGGSGIGRAVAVLFAREGAEVIAMGRKKENLLLTAAMAGETGGVCHTVLGNVSSQSDVKKTVKQAVRLAGGIDVLFNNAGVYSFGKTDDTDEEQWDDIIDINLKGTYLVSRYVIKEMKKKGVGGVIINNASTLGLKPVPNTAAYSASKAGVVSLTKSMALELACDHIRVNCICPGVVETPIHEKIHGEKTVEVMSEMATFHPLGRIGAPEDVAYAALFLASNEASWITGAVLPVDGGISIV